MQGKSDLLQKDTIFYSLFENSRIGQVILDDLYRLAFVNKRMFGFFDLEPIYMEDIMFGQAFHCSNFGASCSECCKFDNKQCNLMHAIKIIQNGGVLDDHTIRFSFKRDNREEIKWFQLNSSFVSYCDQNYILLIFADITDFKQREKRLKELLFLDLATGTTNKYGLVKSMKQRVLTVNS